MLFRTERSSSSSSSSLKLIKSEEMELRAMRIHERDLFERLIEEGGAEIADCEPADARNSMVQQMIGRMNLSPRSAMNNTGNANQPGCKCTKIDCLKMYCECFAKGKTCTPNCECHSCHNTCDHYQHIYKARQLANFRHPNTFPNIPAFVPLRRCTCKKSSCRKNYCECYRAGMKCTEDCQCCDCHNGREINFSLDSRMQIEVNA